MLRYLEHNYYQKIIFVLEIFVYLSELSAICVVLFHYLVPLSLKEACVNVLAEFFDIQITIKICMSLLAKNSESPFTQASFKLNF